MTFYARWTSLFSALWFICAGICHAAPVGGYLFTTFRDETSPMSEQIYMAVSADGRHWQALNKGNPVLISDVGEKGVRDSFLLRSHDGKKVWLIATDLSAYHHRDWNRNTHAGSRSIVVWETDDLVHWSAPRLVTVAAPDAGCTWAPEAIYDPEADDYLVYWASTTARDNYSKQRIWAAHTKDFRTFTTPFIYAERADHIIDIDIVHGRGIYYRFMKDGGTKSITLDTSKSLMGPWRSVPKFTTDPQKDFEGPLLYRLPQTSTRAPDWVLLLDNVGDRIGPGAFGYVPFVSRDPGTGQFSIGHDFSFPYPFRHGSVLPLSKDEVQRLKAKYQTSKTP